MAFSTPTFPDFKKRARRVSPGPFFFYILQKNPFGVPGEDMDAQRLIERTKDFLKVLEQLEKAAAQPKDEFIRDSVIQRFEFTHELAWKMLRLKLESEGLVSRPPPPRETIQVSLQAGLIDNGNLWSDMQKMCNLTSHTYQENLAEEVYDFIISQGLELFRELAEKCKAWQKNG